MNIGVVLQRDEEKVGTGEMETIACRVAIDSLRTLRDRRADLEQARPLTRAHRNIRSDIRQCNFTPWKAHIDTMLCQESQSAALATSFS